MAIKQKKLRCFHKIHSALIASRAKDLANRRRVATIKSMADDLEVQTSKQHRPPEATDSRQLRFLAIFYFLFAAFSGLMSLGIFPAIIAMLAGRATQPEVPSALPVVAGYPVHPHAFGAYPSAASVTGSIVFSLVVWFGMLAMAFVAFAAARYLLDRKRMTYIQVAAVLVSLFFPLGTALGLCTFIVITKQSVRTSFTAS